ncbi:MAG: DUF1553 domain-containing protein [Bernardetiaceae bacterium]|nr:DUF1553 domain-containing protein [Bernardetiaceae bacterium]
MKKTTALFTLAALLAGGTYWYADHHNSKIDFNEQIRPILNKNCLACHGGVKKSSGFSLLFPEEAYAKAKSGKYAIVPGDAAASEMMRRIKAHDPEERMPLDKPPLSQEEIDLLARWIDQGAEWDRHWAYNAPTEPPVPARAWWKRFTDSVPPQLHNPIDHFVVAQLDQVGLAQSPEADKKVLARRVALDLTGLPPTPEQVKAFLADRSPRAYETLVDSLLASPHYGERWAGTWLDLARYADSKGYEKDGYRNIWAFRDYAIRSFNADKPFDQFTTEQIAGDLLPQPTEEQLVATAFHRNTMNNDEGGTDDEEFRTAEVLDRVNTTWDVWQGTTFACIQCHSHPYDPIRHEEYYKFLAFFNNTQDYDRPDDLPLLRTYKEADQAKMRPLIEFIEQRENREASPTLAQNAPPSSNFIPAKNPPPGHGQLAAFNDARTEHGLSNFALRRRLALLPRLSAQEFDEYHRVQVRNGVLGYIRHGSWVMYRNLDLSQVNEIGFEYFATTTGGEVEVRLDQVDGPLVAKATLPPNNPSSIGWWDTKVKLSTVKAPFKAVSGPHNVYFVFQCANTKYNNTMRNDSGDEFLGPFQIRQFFLNRPGHTWGKMETTLARAKDSLAKFNAVTTPIMRDLPPGRERTSHVFVRGNWLTPGDKVTPNVPQSLGGLPTGAPANRLGLAQWMTNSQNPLTARVAVNRFWEQVFGTGLVETLEDFGSQGAKPSHPQLLDWLAVKFQTEYKWSVKRLLKEMVMSATYRQSSVASPQAQALDPANRYLSYAPRTRLSAEQVRDQALAVSGLLSRKMYGPSVMPLQPEGVWQVVYSGQQWQTSQGEDANRRALYTYWRRSSPYPSLMAYDAPSREFCLPRRIRTNTPLQALTSLNDTVAIINARGLVQLAWRQSPGAAPAKVISAAYETALISSPSPRELATLEKLYQQALANFQADPAAAEALAGPAPATGTPALPAQQRAAYTLVANAIMNLDRFVVKE